MVKIKKFLRTKLVFLLFLVLIIPSFSKLIRPGYFPMHDDLQAIRLLQMDKCIKDGQIPCRWVPDMGYGYGYPQFNYYKSLYGGRLGGLLVVCFILTHLIELLIFTLGERWGRCGHLPSFLLFFTQAEKWLKEREKQ